MKDNWQCENVCVFYDDAKSQLEKTRHFGLISVGIGEETRTVTRRDYVQRHSEQLLKLKQVVPGLGLGSQIKFPSRREGRDDWKPIKGRRFTGLDLCQSWAVLLNAGHLWGTFATERGLLFQLDKNHKWRELFIENTTHFDKPRGNELRCIIENALDKAHLYRFFYLLALWRLRDKGISNLHSDDLSCARLLIKAFLMPPTEQIRRMVDIFKKTRQLTYLRMHDDCKLTKTMSIGKLSDDNLCELFPIDALPEADSLVSSRWKVLEAIDRRDANDIFGGEQVAAAVLAHSEYFKLWWQARLDKGTTVEACVDELFDKPNDWPSRKIRSYKHFIELRIPSRVGWLTEVRLWLRDDQQRDPWKGSNFLVSPTPHESILNIDVYGQRKGLPISVLRHVVTQLTRAYQCTHDEAQSRALWMTCARLIARAFRCCLNPNYSLRLSPIKAAPGHIGYACIGHTYEFVRGLVKVFLPYCRDSQRALELRHTITIADSMGHWRSPAMLLVARAEVFDAEAQAPVTDIDGLLGIFIGNDLNWLIVETKQGRGDGAKQLTKGLGRALNCALPPINVVEGDHQDAWYFTVKSPLHLL